MARALVAAVLPLLVLGLSGCTVGAPDGQPDPTRTTTAALPSASVPAAPPAPLLTDTMHLLDPPHVAGTVGAVDGPVDPIRVPLQGDAPLARHPQWSIPRPEGLQVIDGAAQLWVDVQGSVVNTGSGGCFWQVTFLVESSPGVYHVHPFCAPDAAMVPAGTRSIVLSTAGFDIRGDPGTEILVSVSLNGVVGPGSSVSLLTGTPGHDSTVTITGLQLPIDTRTLLG